MKYILNLLRSLLLSLVVFLSSPMLAENIYCYADKLASTYSNVFDDSCLEGVLSGGGNYGYGHSVTLTWTTSSVPAKVEVRGSDGSVEVVNSPSATSGRVTFAPTQQRTTYALHLNGSSSAASSTTVNLYFPVYIGAVSENFNAYSPDLSQLAGWALSTFGPCEGKQTFRTDDGKYKMCVAVPQGLNIEVSILGLSYLTDMIKVEGVRYTDPKSGKTAVYTVYTQKYVSYVNGGYVDYKVTEDTSDTPNISELQKCATPLVIYTDGSLEMSCETDGAEFITDILAADAKKYHDPKINFSATYNIDVFAIKEAYENSDTLNVALVWIENGEVNDNSGTIIVKGTPVLIQGNGGTIRISGMSMDTKVDVYTIDGTKVASTFANDGTATIDTGLHTGTIVVVKFGTKSVKIRI